MSWLAGFQPSACICNSLEKEFRVWPKLLCFQSLWARNMVAGLALSLFSFEESVVVACVGRKDRVHLNHRTRLSRGTCLMALSHNGEHGRHQLFGCPEATNTLNQAPELSHIHTYHILLTRSTSWLAYRRQNMAMSAKWLCFASLTAMKIAVANYLLQHRHSRTLPPTLLRPRCATLSPSLPRQSRILTRRGQVMDDPHSSGNII